MRIYVASSWRNDLQPGVVARLRAAGHEVYDFRNPAPGNTGFGWRQLRAEPPPWSAAVTRDVLAHPVADAGFAFDAGALRWADACVMVQPCGRSAALELGWAAGAGKLTIALLADGQEPELMLKLAGRVCVTLDEVVGVLAAWDRAAAPAGLHAFIARGARLETVAAVARSIVGCNPDDNIPEDLVEDLRAALAALPEVV